MMFCIEQAADSLRNLTESGIQWYSVQGFFIRRPVSTVHEKSDSNMKFIMNSLIDILKGAVMGLANVIPGVSGGTMMVAMGIYDKLIYSITHIFKEFKKSLLTLLPYGIGMLLAIALGSFALKAAFASFPLPTNTLFIGLILGSVPMILKEMQGTRRGIPGIILFILFFALVVLLKVFEANNFNDIQQIGLLDMLKFLCLGALASATMIIPGVSGSMLLKTLGYYEPIVTQTIPSLLVGLSHRDGGAILHGISVLLPFAIGILLGIYFVAKLIEWLLNHHKGLTYCAILGMVIASPVVTLMDGSLFQNLSWGVVLASLITFAFGFFVATKLGKDPEKK